MKVQVSACLATYRLVMELKHRLAVAAVFVGWLLATVLVFAVDYIQRPAPFD